MKYQQPLGGAVDDPYVDGNPATGTPGSPVPAKALEHTQREIVAAIEAAGLTPDEGDLNQLKKSGAILSVSGGFCVVTGAANAYVLEPESPRIRVPSLKNGMRFYGTTANPNTMATVVNVHGTGNAPVVTKSGAALTGGEITADFELEYDGANERFILISYVAPADDIPIGIIAMWSGLAANIPSGWLLCDGTSGTPDLIDKFIRGSATAGSTGGADTHTHTDTFAVANHTLTTAQMPSHTHTASHSPNSGTSSLFGRSSNETVSGSHSTNSAGSGAAHNHGLSGSVASASNLPAYYTLCFIIKV